MTHHPFRGAAALLCAGLLTATPGAAQTAARDSGALVTLLGRDTLAAERWVRTAGRIEAEAVVRSPSTSYRRYTMELTPAGTMRRFEERWLDPAARDAAPRRTEVIEAADGGWVRRVTQGDSTRSTRIEAPATALPFIDLVHWPFEMVVRGGDGPRPLLSGGRALAFTVARAGDRVTVTHPMRGPSTFRVDGRGRVLGVDASATTRKVISSRVARMDVLGAARRWAAADAAGRGIGELSGRGSGDFTVGGARIVLDYGTPARRGRDIFGNIVPWGAVWRTGANRATHLSTTRDLVLGDPATGLRVPAGEYTLFSIPQRDGGVLIVSRQTGQNGTQYDPARDLGRVPMRRVAVAEPSEQFTIRVVPEGAGGTLRLAWDRSEFLVPVAVR